MATVTPQKPETQAAQSFGEDAGLRAIHRAADHQKTRQHVKWVDIAGTLMTLAGGTLALSARWWPWSIIGCCAKDWASGGRLLALIALVVGGGTYAAIDLLPLLLRRINPVYAAHAIEQSRPTLKNTLVNFLLLRSSREGVSQSVYQAVEQQAAARLSQVHVESAVDRSKLIKISLPCWRSSRSAACTRSFHRRTRCRPFAA